METQIIKAFNELKNEARVGEVKLGSESDYRIFRILFNIVEEKEMDEIPNLYIKDKSEFYKNLIIYIYKCLKFCNLEENYDNIKLILSFVFVNITNLEMNDLNTYLNKYINFLDDEVLSNKTGSKNTTLGLLKYETNKQSIQQETPYCFKSYFEDNDSKYALPRISYGIDNGVCYIYAIQNKDSKINTDSKYNFEVKQKLRTINSSISKYRNVTPSFVVALSLFISFLRENNITKIKVVTPLPIRQKNRDLALDYKIKFYTMSGNLDNEEKEILKKELINKKINDDYNSTVKFMNCFNRLKLHFDNLFINKGLDEEVTIEIINLITQNEFLEEIVKVKER